MKLSISCTLIFFASQALAVPPPFGGIWQTLAPIPIVRQEHVTVATSPTTFFILGGIVPDGTSWATTDLLQSYSIPTNTWHTSAPLPVPLNHPNAAYLDGKIYLLGGLTAPSPTDWVATPSAWVYDLTLNAWSSLPSAPAPLARGSAAVGVYKHTIFLAGGVTLLTVVPGGTQATISSVIAFNTLTSKWITLPPAARDMPEPRDHAGAAVVDNTFYVLGGRAHGQGNVKDTVFALDLENLEKGWVVKKGRMPTARGGLAAAAVGRRIYTFGGEGNKEVESGVFNETEVYDTVRDGWRREGGMKVPRHGTSAVAVGGKVYIPGGGIVQGGGPVGVLDAYVPGTGKW